MSYIAATAGFPLQGATFDAWDRYLHFDWVQMMTWVSLHPRMQWILELAYFSFAVQTVTTVLALGIAGQLDRFSTFVLAFVCTTLVTIAISAICPAAGPWLFLDLQPSMANGFLPASSTSWPVFLGLRDGTLHTVYGLNSERIITFPSLHAALGILFAVALWRVSVVRWIALVLNGLMVIATPAYGSHDVVDVIAGILIAAVCWVTAVRLFATGPDSTPEYLATIEDPPRSYPRPYPKRHRLRVAQA
ncbi:phosphatase PAP2 family protein [Bradyrhizobium sp. BWA-3-5]|uniref:phosphatase PAP2 family protein n=1 Tax=Bradyrhizobium sp. BWA-3-5 TaxID=3080013 RepID=UPI00293F534E|nr:phosphatase PAP2 family protein [Bradyrhizobium sp. BWA-3-5]WOH67432.1 phosphatase PAP2 family protein [Bradyrhizobium sp. BWA-3-5]